MGTRNLWAIPQVEQRVYDVHRPLSKRKRRFYCTKNQDGIDKIASADYMTATTAYSKIPDDRKVNFDFDRQMARVVITIAGFNNEFSDKASVPKCM